MGYEPNAGIRRSIRWADRAARRHVSCVSLMLTLGVALIGAANAQSLTWLGTIPDGQWSAASDVSADGTTVVGVAFNASNQSRAAYWTPLTGMIDLGTLDGESSYAYGVSADGVVVVGQASNGSHARAFRWTPATGMQDIGTLGGCCGEARGVSADGSVIVGHATNASEQPRAFRWTPTSGMQDIGSLPNAISVAAFGVSANGSVVVGIVEYRFSSQAFRWSETTGIQVLQTGAIGYYNEARAASGDGSVVVGTSGTLSFWRAFRWTAESGRMHDLGTVTGGQCCSEGLDVSADGTVVVGMSINAALQFVAFRWTAGSRRMEDLNITYADLLRDGSHLMVAEAVSVDGRYIVGQGYNATAGRNEAFLLDTWRTGDTNGDGCIDDADLLAVLFAFGTPGTGYTRHEDINKDRTVDDADLLIVLFNFGQGC